MMMAGDAEGQPAEGAVTLSDLAEEMDAGLEDDGSEVGEEEEAEDSEPQDVEDESDEQEDEEEPEEEPTVVLKHDGKEVTLKQSEVIALAQQGFDYSKKTMAVAEERKAVEAERNKAVEVRQQTEQALDESFRRLAALAHVIEQEVGAPPDVALAAQDAAYYLAQKEQHESKKGKLQQVYAELARVQDEQTRQRQVWIAETAQETERTLRDTLPGWSDNTIPQLAEYASKVGVTPQNADVAMLVPGFWQLLHKAKAFDELQEQRAKLKPKSELPKVHKPSATHTPNRNQRRVEAEKRYASKPSLSTLADLIE